MPANYTQVLSPVLCPLCTALLSHHYGSVRAKRTWHLACIRTQCVNDVGTGAWCRAAELALLLVTQSELRPCTGAPPRGGYRGRAQGGQLQLGGRAGPGPRRVFDEPEDVEFVRVMKGHTKHITALAVDHGSSQVHALTHRPDAMHC